MLSNKRSEWNVKKNVNKSARPTVQTDQSDNTRHVDAMFEFFTFSLLLNLSFLYLTKLGELLKTFPCFFRISYKKYKNLVTPSLKKIH